MQVLISILLVFALIFGVVFFIPDSCRRDKVEDQITDDGSGSDTGDTPPTYEDGTADSGVNVTTGKLKVDIIDVDGVSVVGEKLDFIGKEDGAPVLFQPGDAFYTEGFKIKNNGDVKMAYKMFISPQEDMDMAKFSEAFNFYLTTDPLNLKDSIKMLEFNGTLEAGQASATFYIVVTMNPEAGNEFQSLTFTGLGITVNASQVIGD